MLENESTLGCLFTVKRILRYRFLRISFVLLSIYLHQRCSHPWQPTLHDMFVKRRHKRALILTFLSVEMEQPSVFDFSSVLHLLWSYLALSNRTSSANTKKKKIIFRWKHKSWKANTRENTILTDSLYYLMYLQQPYISRG